MTSKHCICCGELKPLEAFSLHKQMRDGRLNKCKPCCVEYSRQYRAAKPKQELQAIRRAEYEKRKEEGKIDRGAANIALRKWYHSRRTNGPAQTELDALVMEEAARLSQMRTAATGIKWGIDHVEPIKGKDVCGLHNAFNLQVVPTKWNSSKGNRRTEFFFARA